MLKLKFKGSCRIWRKRSRMILSKGEEQQLCIWVWYWIFISVHKAIKFVTWYVPISKMFGEIPLLPLLPSTFVVDTLFGQCPTTLIIPCSVCGINSLNMHYFAKYENWLGVIFLLSDTKFKNTCPITIHFKTISVCSKVFVECNAAKLFNPRN